LEKGGGGQGPVHSLTDCKQQPVGDC
jgi:hypothetical protein